MSVKNSRFTVRLVLQCHYKWPNDARSVYFIQREKQLICNLVDFSGVFTKYYIVSFGRRKKFNYNFHVVNTVLIRF